MKIQNENYLSEGEFQMAFAKKDERRLIPVASYVGKVHMEKLKEYSESLHLSISRLIGMAIDDQLFEKKYPFNWEFDLDESEEYIEYAFADEAGRIFSFLKGLPNGLSKDQLMIVRHDMNIKDKKTFMLAFRELLEKKMIEPYIASKSVKYPTKWDTILYRVVGTSPSANRKQRNKNDDYALLQKLKKKFGE